MTRRPYRLFEVAGLELEYAIVDEQLVPHCWVERAFRGLAGRPTSEVPLGGVTLSNELAAHVLEMKTTVPQASLVVAEKQVVTGVRRLSSYLRENLGARLMPAGMHPFMRPTDTALWSRSGRDIYATYAKVFEIHEHGWLNVQSCQVNLPFGSDEQTVAMYNAAACLIPYLPALAASSPIVEGRLARSVDRRMIEYGRNQRRIPIITGQVVPDYLDRLPHYRGRLLGSIYRALGDVPGAERLRHEWINSRGAILRFDRRAMEIRVLDLQECVRMDVAIAAFVRGALAWLSERLLAGRLELPPHAALVADYRKTIVAGSRAEVAAPHLSRPRAKGRAARSARAVIEGLVERAEAHVPAGERAYLELVAERARRGSLGERIAEAVERAPVRKRRARIEAIYRELADCLESNTPW